jgi:hypothetical protein
MPPLPVTVWTLWHGAEVAGPGSIELVADEIAVKVPSAAVDLRVPFATLDGVKTAPHHIALYASSGDVLEVDGQGVGDLGDQVRSRVCTLPELTLALRGLGSARGFPGPDHDRFYAPILAARRAAEHATDPAGRMAAMRAPALAAEVDRALHELAVARYPDAPADRRALETVLEDLSAPIRASLVQLESAARAVAAASDDVAFVWWRAWTAQCRSLLTHVDQSWLAIAPVLKETPLVAPRARRWSLGRQRPASGQDPAERDA